MDTFPHTSRKHKLLEQRPTDRLNLNLCNTSLSMRFILVCGANTLYNGGVNKSTQRMMVQGKEKETFQHKYN